MLKLDKSQITRNLGKKYKLVPFLEKSLSDFDEPWGYQYEEKEKDTAWHPSGHCTPLATELWEITQGVDTFGPISGALRKSFQVGHFWHQLLQHIVLHKLEFCKPEAIERRGTRIWGTVEASGTKTFTNKDLFKPFCWVTGSGDIAPVEVPKWKGIVDFKTMSSHQFKQAGIPEWAAAKYECQINLYMDFFDEGEAIIVPINKDTPHDMKEFLYKRNQPLIDIIYEKLEFVSVCLEADEAPTKADDEMFKLDHLLTGPVST
jgi:hypothetical protein